MFLVKFLIFDWQLIYSTIYNKLIVIDNIINYYFQINIHNLPLKNHNIH